VRGKKLEHQKFGFGIVLKMEGAAHNPIATIKFDLNGEKIDHVELCEVEDCGLKQREGLPAGRQGGGERDRGCELYTKLHK